MDQNETDIAPLHSDPTPLPVTHPQSGQSTSPSNDAPAPGCTALSNIFRTQSAATNSATSGTVTPTRANQQNSPSPSSAGQSSSPHSTPPTSNPDAMTSPSDNRPPPNPLRLPITRISLPSSSVAQTPNLSNNSGDNRAHHRNAAFVKALQGRTFYIPHAITRFNQQLKYIENITEPQLTQHVPELRKLFLAILSL